MSWLSSIQLVDKIRKNGDKDILSAFYGVCSIDHLPEFIHTRPFLMIVNTHTKNLPGEHWIAVMIDTKRNGEVFDSLALPVSNILIRWLNRFTIKWTTNKLAFQYVLSSTCGIYSLYFILNRLRVKNFNTFTALFDKNSHVNESLVKVFYRSLK